MATKQITSFGNPDMAVVATIDDITFAVSAVELTGELGARRLLLHLETATDSWDHEFVAVGSVPVTGIVALDVDMLGVGFTARVP